MMDGSLQADSRAKRIINSHRKKARNLELESKGGARKDLRTPLGISESFKFRSDACKVIQLVC